MEDESPKSPKEAAAEAKRRIKEIHSTLLTEGWDPNEAFKESIKRVTAEDQQRKATQGALRSAPDSGRSTAAAAAGGRPPRPSPVCRVKVRAHADPVDPVDPVDRRLHAPHAPRQHWSAVPSGSARRTVHS